MSVIYNKSKAVKVLKAINYPVLRLFPGYNSVGLAEEEIQKAYVDNNEAAKGLFKECLSFASSKSLSKENMIEAKKAKDKNEELNKSRKIIKQREKKLKDTEKVVKDQEKTIKDLTARLEKLEKDTKDKK